MYAQIAYTRIATKFIAKIVGSNRSGPIKISSKFLINQQKNSLFWKKYLSFTFCEYPSQSPVQSLHRIGCSENQLAMNKSSIPLDRACIDGQPSALIARIDKVTGAAFFPPSF